MPSSSSNRRSRTSRLFHTAAVVFAGFLLIAVGWVGVRLLQAIQNNQIRCYILSPPLTLFEKDILTGEAFSCQAQNCRVVTRFNTNRGIMCLFPGRGLAQAVGSQFAKHDIYPASNSRLLLIPIPASAYTATAKSCVPELPHQATILLLNWNRPCFSNFV